MKRKALMPILIAATAVALLEILRFALPHSVLGISTADRPLLVAAGWTKLLCLATAALFALRCVTLLE